MVKERLRNVERLILKGLEIDARIPLSRLGKSIRRSQQQVSYTLNSLVDKGIIQSLYSLIDYSKLGVLAFRVYFKVNYISKEKHRKLLEYLVSASCTSWVATCGGRYDLICTFFANNPSRFNKTLKAVLARFPMQFQNYTVLTTIVNRKFGRKYLLRGPGKLPEMIFGGDREPEAIDDNDMMIMAQLAEDARKSSVEISEKLSVTPKTVIDRVKKLRERAVLLGFKPLVDPRRMGYVPIILLIRYHNIKPELEKKLIRFLRTHPNVTWIVKTLGEWDIEISIEAPDSMELRNIEMEIRQQFATLIQDTETIPLYQNHKKTFFPGFLLEGRNGLNRKD